MKKCKQELKTNHLVLSNKKSKRLKVIAQNTSILNLKKFNERETLYYSQS